MEDILQTNPDVDAVFAANDQMALGAIQAIAAHKKTDQIKLIGFDGALEATQHILAGDMYATIAQDPYGMAQDGRRGGAQEARAASRSSRASNTGAKLITPETPSDYFEEVRGKLGGTGARARGLSRLAHSGRWMPRRPAPAARRGSRGRPWSTPQRRSSAGRGSRR